MDERTNIGPLATAQIRDDLDDQVQRSVAGGARLALGGKPRDGAGFFYEPTVLADVPRESPAFREETFGPRRRDRARARRRRRDRASPTIRASGSAPRRGRETTARSSDSRAGSRRAACSSTGWSRRTRASRSAA